MRDLLVLKVVKRMKQKPVRIKGLIDLLVLKAVKQNQWQEDYAASLRDLLVLKVVKHNEHSMVPRTGLRDLLVLRVVKLSTTSSSARFERFVSFEGRVQALFIEGKRNNEICKLDCEDIYIVDKDLCLIHF